MSLRPLRERSRNALQRSLVSLSPDPLSPTRNLAEAVPESPEESPGPSKRSPALSARARAATSMRPGSKTLPSILCCGWGRRGIQPMRERDG
jgi:hypothetical protein